MSLAMKARIGRRSSATLASAEVAVELQGRGDRAADMSGMQPAAGSTRTVAIFSGVVVRDLLDVHAAFGRDDEGDARGGAVDEAGEIEFAGDAGAFLDIEAVDDLALRARSGG